MKPLNPEWDARRMDALVRGGAALQALDALSDRDIERDAGLPAHESRTRLVARAALPTDTPLSCRLRHYQAVPGYIAGYIAGCGALWLQQP